MKDKKKSKKVLLRTLLIILAVVAALFIGFLIYAGNYYHSGELAKEALQGNEFVKVEELSDGVIAFVPEEAVAALIFYPGGKVEYTAYAPLLKACAEQDILCLLVKMPFNLAIFDINAADGLKDKYPEIKNWYLCGHSLGGAMAASYAAKNVDDYKGLILLAAYSTDDLSESGLDVLCCYGTEDKVMNKANYEANVSKLPNTYETVEIFGGCHAGFGDYGAQKGDGKPGIDGLEQAETAAEYIADFIYKGIQMK